MTYELGGAIGRTASGPCQRNEHDDCPDVDSARLAMIKLLANKHRCHCRCHESIGDAVLCARCGLVATGFAMINNERYCHGDEQRPSCYELTSWEITDNRTDKWLTGDNT